MGQKQSLLHHRFDGYKLLNRISHMIDNALNRADIIRPVLQEISAVLGDNVRLAVCLLNRDTDRVEIEEAIGLTEDQQLKGRYDIGEGATGRCFESGEPVIVLDVGEDPHFLGRTGRIDVFEDPLFVCVPIKLERKVIGTFSGLFDAEQALANEYARFFVIVASLIAGAVRFRQIDEEKQRLQNQLKEKYKPRNIIGNSKSMRNVYMQIGQVGQSDATVLLRGESGVGKELVASAIHYASARANGPFVKVNCAALPENILESELFGHEKGAFTGAIRTRKGRFEQANGGTLFLDEIGDFSPSMQVSLLRVLQEQEFHRVGGDASIKINVRIIAATNRDLEFMIEDESFRADLYYRLNVFPIRIPPLRERKEDINTLADFFVQKYNNRGQQSIRRITTPALNALMTYQWPGNVRELENCIERAILVADGPVIQERDLPPSLQTASTSDTRTSGTLQAILDSREKEMIMETIIETRGNMARAARMLGVTERQMGTRVKKYGINPKAYR